MLVIIEYEAVKVHLHAVYEYSVNALLTASS